MGKLQQRLATSLAVVNRLCETTPTPQYAAAPDQNILKNLLPECEDSDFWQNFKKNAHPFNPRSISVPNISVAITLIPIYHLQIESL